MAASSGCVRPFIINLRCLSLRLEQMKSYAFTCQCPLSFNLIRHNSNSASITRPRRNCYTRTYSTLLVFPDGSTINIRYKEPRQIIKLPLDFSKLSESEKRLVLSKRKPKEKIEVEEEFDDTYDASEYTKYWKK